jgi:hypothetical protein
VAHGRFPFDALKRNAIEFKQRYAAFSADGGAAWAPIDAD